MPMTPAQMERRIEQNTNDIEAIYDLLKGMDGRLVNIEGQLTEVLSILKDGSS